MTLQHDYHLHLVGRLGSPSLSFCLSRFNCNFVAISEGSPQTLSIKSILQQWIDFRCEVIRKRTQFKKNKADKRRNIVQVGQALLLWSYGWREQGVNWIEIDG